MTSQLNKRILELSDMITNEIKNGNWVTVQHLQRNLDALVETLKSIGLPCGEIAK
jgi:uncharacterized coiled-coil protein SlyX